MLTKHKTIRGTKNIYGTPGVPCLIISIMCVIFVCFSLPFPCLFFSTHHYLDPTTVLQLLVCMMILELDYDHSWATIIIINSIFIINTNAWILILIVICLIFIIIIMMMHHDHHHHKKSWTNEININLISFLLYYYNIIIIFFSSHDLIQHLHRLKSKLQLTWWSLFRESSSSSHDDNINSS